MRSAEVISELLWSHQGACLLDCGATALIAMRRFAIDPGQINAIFLSHLHGDHFAGVLFLLLEQHFIARRDQPLLIAGPVGTEGRVMAALDVFFPGAAQLAWHFPLRFAELRNRRPRALARLPSPPMSSAILGQRGLRVSSEDRQSSDRLFRRHRVDRCPARGRA
jgi:ribonuclease BN (tRNA processing enzyme)